MVKDSTQFRQRFNRWKNGAKVYDAGKPISDDEYYSTMENVAKENWEKWGDVSEDAALTRILNANDYDYRGYYNKYPKSKANADTHWTDEFKTVYHPTFSEQSIYSGKKSKFNPEGLKGGSWGENDKFYPQNWQMFGTKYNRSRLIPKYDGGTSDNPWIPKGTKVPTENSKEVIVSTQPRTTYIGDGNQPEATKPAYREPINPQTGRPYTIYEKDLPLSGTDPVGLAIVEGEAVGPLFKGLGWLGGKALNFATPYIGRAMKPVTNWFAAKALSNSIDDAVATPTFSKVLPDTEQIWQDLNLPRHSYQGGSMKGPFTEQIFRRNGVFDAFDAFDNPARKRLVERLSEEAGFPLQVPTGNGTFPDQIKILTDVDADKILGKDVNGLRDGYSLLARESADPTTIFHEALHLQGFGKVDWNFPKLYTLLDDYQEKKIKLDQLESSGAPFMQIRDAKRDYYAAQQAYDQLFKQTDATKQFLEQKVKSVLRDDLVDDAEEYIRQPHEFVVHGLQAGRKVGLKPYQQEPTFDPYNTGVPIVDFGKIKETVNNAVKKHPWMGSLKLDTPKDYHDAWKVLTGNFLPVAVITGGTFGALQEHNKGRSIKPPRR